MKNNQSVKEYLLENFSLDLPISGGDGSSIEEAIVIELGKNEDWSDVEYTVLTYILWTKKWKIIDTSYLEKNGKHYDKVKIEWDEDKNLLHNYYFDVTKAYGSTVLWAGPHSKRHKI